MSHLTPVPSDPDQLRAWLDELGRSQVGSMLDELANPEIELPAPPDDAQSLTVKVALRHTKPPVWRRIVLAGDTTLDEVHDVVQGAMGWTDTHLHRFYAGPTTEAPHLVTDEDLDEGEEGTPEDGVRLDQLLREPGDRITYDYDFGDGWEHELRLEKVDPADGEPPRCIAGRLACPPEDVGGTWAYAEVAAWVRAGRPAADLPSQFESVEDADDWLPLDWDPDVFDLADAGLMLQATRLSADLLGRLRPGAIGAVLRLSPAYAPSISSWLTHAAQASLTPQDLEELTEPYRKVLAILGGGAELSASGYLRPEVVGQLWPALGVRPILAGKGNRESNIRPLLLFRRTMQHAGLLHAQYGRLMPTVAGIRFGDDPAALWSHVADRLPTGRAELKLEVGWFTLLAVAGGVRHQDVYDTVSELAADAGWDARTTTLGRTEVTEAIWPTMAALFGARWSSIDAWPAWASAAAASVVFM